MLLRYWLSIFFVLNTATAFAQCTEGNGIPIINETFATGTSQYGPELPAGITNLKFAQNSPCPVDGYYSIVNYTSGCFKLWQTVTDHTGDKGGYFMLIDASLEPSDFFKKTITGLCEGTTYEFSAYLLNMFAVAGGTNPDVTFTIESTGGTVLKSYNTGQIPITSPISWKKAGFYFTTTPGINTVVLRMHNNAPGGTGNDLAIDDISFTPTGPKIAIAVNGVQDNVFYYNCYNSDIVLSSTVGQCYLNNGYQWQVSVDKIIWKDLPSAIASNYHFILTGEGTRYFRLNVAQQGNNDNANCSTYSNVVTIHYHIYGTPNVVNMAATICPKDSYKLPSGKRVSSTGVYSDTVYNETGCVGTITTLNLTLRDKANLGGDKTICLGDSVLLNPGAYSKYTWQDGSTKPTFAGRLAGTYSVTVTDANGCITADTIEIKKGSCPSVIKPPNVFSPNNDGNNDTWDIDGLSYFTNCTVYVYSRYGGIVYKSTGYKQPWDGRNNGKDLPSGTYYYVINLGEQSLPISGYVLVIR